MPPDRHSRSGQPGAWRRLIKLLPPLIGLLLLGGAIYAVQKEFRHLSIAQIRDSMAAIPARRLLISAGFTLLSYLVLSFYDRLAVLHVGHRLSVRRTAFAAFCSYVLSHNLGFAAISGAAVRFRLYGSWGLAPLQITRIIAFCSVTYVLGACALIGGVLLLEPGALASLHTHLPHVLLTLIGVAAWSLVAAYVGLSAWRSSVRLWRWTIPLPGVPMAIGQVAVASLDVAATAAIAYALLPPGIGLGYPAFLAIYIACYSAGLLASVPGGLGVFDGAMVLGLSPFIPPAGAVVVILVFRLFYYIVPLFIAGLLFAGHELFLRGDSLLASRAGPDRAPPPRPSVAIRESEADFAVTVAVGAVMLCGAMLLASGLVWGVPDDLAVVMPTLASPGSAPGLGGLFGGDGGGLPGLIETIGDYVLSLIGAVLVGLAIGLSQRVTLAWGATLVLLCLAAAIAALRGLPLGVPAVLILAALVVAPFRASYYRHARLFSEPLSPATLMPLLLLLGSLLILARLEPAVGGIAGNGWLQLVFGQGLTPRMRLSVGLSVLVGLLAIARLIRPGHVSALAFSGEARERYQALAGASACTGPDGGPGGGQGGGLMAGETGRALVRFRRERGLLIGLGDPVGPPSDQVSAIWRLRDLAMQEKRDPAFWRVGQSLLPVYADLGLVAWKLDGETDRAAALYLCCPAERGAALIAMLSPEPADP